MNWTSYFHSVVMILFCVYSECEGVEADIGKTENFTAVSGTIAEITCKLTSGTIDWTEIRQWNENGKLIMNDGILVDANSGYTERVNEGNTSFTLITPEVNNSFDGYKYTCKYGFSEANFHLTVIQEATPDESTVTTDYTTKATTNSTSSIVNSTACSTKSTSCSTSSPTTTHVMIIVLPSVGCGGLIIIIIIVIILKQRHLKTPKNNISQTQQKTGLENAACSNL